MDERTGLGWVIQTKHETLSGHRNIGDNATVFQAEVSAFKDLADKSISSLNKIAETNKVTIRWIKAHVGHPGNEHADEEAKLGSEAELREGELPAPTSKATCKMLVKIYGIWSGKTATNADKPRSSSPKSCQGPTPEGRTSVSCPETTVLR